MTMMNKMLFGLGIALSLAGAAIMFEGSVFGDRTMGVAIVLGITGICLISSSRKESRQVGDGHGR